MNTRDLTRKTALVTGAGSGIGRATALLMASRGADLVICDLDRERLERTASEARATGRKVLARHLDVADRAAMEDFAAEVHGEVEAVDLLMNNAGVGMGARLLDMSLDDWSWIVGVNLFGVIHGCHFFIPPMVRRGRGGHVINMSSAAGYTPIPASIAYGTTKFGVLGLSEGLRAELTPFGIGVTAVCPGFIDTDIVTSARLRGVAAEPENYRRTKEFYRRRNYGPERVARRILRAVHKNRLVLPVTVEAWAMYCLMRTFPGVLRSLNAAIARRQLADRSGVPDDGSCTF
jgi:NAD(P)-dependent dehydrogenase (short-subunit alcohol dehydrogenase family)